MTIEGPAEDIGADMAEASVFVLSSRFEGFPLILLEAMSKGMGIVSFDCPTGPADIVDDHRNGLLVPAEDVEGLARAIREIVEDEELRRRMAAAAVETAQEYTIEAIGPLWEELFAELSRGPERTRLNASRTRGKRRATSPRRLGGTTRPSAVIVTTSGTRNARGPWMAGTPAGREAGGRRGHADGPLAALQLGLGDHDPRLQPSRSAVSTGEPVARAASRSPSAAGTRCRRAQRADQHVGVAALDVGLRARAGVEPPCRVRGRDPAHAARRRCSKRRPGMRASSVRLTASSSSGSISRTDASVSRPASKRASASSPS